MNVKNAAVALALIVVLGLFLWGAGAPTTGSVEVRQDTYCPESDEQWSDWRWQDDAHSLRCSWQLTPPEFLEPDPQF